MSILEKLEKRFKIQHKEDFHHIHNRPKLRKRLVALIIVHYIAVIANIGTFLIALPLFIWKLGILGLFPAISLMVFVFNLAFARVECPATRAENKLRLQLGLPEIKTFIKHYMMPWRK